MTAALPETIDRHSRPWKQPVCEFAGRFSRSYWAFFISAFCMDIGFGLYVFLFNLYLTDLHFDERLIGRVLALFTLGNVAGTVPAMIAARRYGLRPLLLFVFIAAPVFAAMRLFYLQEPAQLTLAFLTGAALCGWPIGFSPMIAQFTDDRNRTAGFSIAFATGIGVGTLSGFAGGYIPELLHTGPLHLSLTDGIRVVLLMACAIVAVGACPLAMTAHGPRISSQGAHQRIFHPYLFRFLPAFVLWSLVAGSFPLFGAVYLQKALGFPIGRLGAVFAASQFMQFIAVLSAPCLFRRTGIGTGVSLGQLATAVLLVSLAEIRSEPAAVCVFVLYFAAQFMCGPGIYQMLMEQIPESERSSASAVQNLSGALCQAGAAAIAGTCIVVYGYRALLAADAMAAVLASLFFAWLGFQAQTTGPRTLEMPRAASVSDVPSDGEWSLQKAAE